MNDFLLKRLLRPVVSSLVEGARVGEILRESTIPDPPKHMVDFYEKRTGEHIARVFDNILRLSMASVFKGDVEELIVRGTEHDTSKYGDEERIPYIWLTWWYREKDNGREFKYPEGVKELVDQATGTHIKANAHHPEFHGDPQKMSDVDLAEMVCDWAAMSQEKGTSLQEWFEKVQGEETELINPKDRDGKRSYKWTDDQIKTIQSYVSFFDLDGKGVEDTLEDDDEKKVEEAVSSTPRKQLQESPRRGMPSKDEILVLCQDAQEVWDDVYAEDPFPGEEKEPRWVVRPYRNSAVPGVVARIFNEEDGTPGDVDYVLRQDDEGEWELIPDHQLDESVPPNRVALLRKKFPTAKEFNQARLGGFGAVDVPTVLGHIDKTLNTRLDTTAIRLALQDAGTWFFLHEVPLSRLQGVDVPPATGGLQTPIVVGESGEIIDGRHRVAAAREQGLKTLPAYIPASLFYELELQGLDEAVRTPSVLVGPDGTPITLYQGNDTAGINRNPKGGSEYGIYLTAKRGYASRYGKNVHRTWVKLGNPLYVQDKSEISPRDLTEQDVHRLVSQGYDGIISGNPDRPDEVVLFDPSALVQFEDWDEFHGLKNSGLDESTSVAYREFQKGREKLKAEAREKLKAYRGKPLEDAPMGYLDAAAFGIQDEWEGEFPLAAIDAYHSADYENAEYAAGDDPVTWAQGVSFEDPIEIHLKDGLFKIEDGHHRFFAAETLGKETVFAMVHIDDNPIRELEKQNFTLGEA